MTGLALGAATIMGLLGLVHLAFTLRDFGPRPVSFSPIDASLLDPMRRTRTALAPDGRDYWTGILGFHLSHSLGVIQFAVLIVIATMNDITGLKLGLVVLGCCYTVISYRCWFVVPTAGVLVATGLMIAGWTL
jgi:hypothetical protein